MTREAGESRIRGRSEGAPSRSRLLLTILLWIMAIPLLLLLLLVLSVVESSLLGTHTIDQMITVIHLDEVYLWLYHCF